MLVSAVELVVGHYVRRGEVAAEVVEAVDAQIKECFRVVNKIFAYDIASVVFITITLFDTICVLYFKGYTL